MVSPYNLVMEKNTKAMFIQSKYLNEQLDEEDEMPADSYPGRMVENQ